jgi:hypothetical protein
MLQKRQKVLARAPSTRDPSQIFSFGQDQSPENYRLNSIHLIPPAINTAYEVLDLAQ